MGTWSRYSEGLQQMEPGTQPVSSLESWFLGPLAGLADGHLSTQFEFQVGVCSGFDPMVLSSISGFFSEKM